MLPGSYFLRLRSLFLVAAIVFKCGCHSQENSKEHHKAEKELDKMVLQLELYLIDYGSYPDVASWKAAVGGRSDKSPKSSVVNSLPTDPWGHAYVYEYDKETDAYRLYSVGPDGYKGGVGINADIVRKSPSWD